MKLLLDFLPILLFFGAYKLDGIYTATAVLMAATALQMGYIYMTERRLQPIHKITLVLIMGFGALTLALHDERFIKWKPTVLYAGMALALAWFQWIAHRNVLKLLLGSQLSLPDGVWARLGAAWVTYCSFMSILNGYVVVHYSTEAWVGFKLWGYAFPLAFIIGQGLYIARHLREDPPAGDA
jgi:intracellular septation protein